MIQPLKSCYTTLRTKIWLYPHEIIFSPYYRVRLSLSHNLPSKMPIQLLWLYGHFNFFFIVVFVLSLCHAYVFILDGFLIAFCCFSDERESFLKHCDLRMQPNSLDVIVSRHQFLEVITAVQMKDHANCIDLKHSLHL